MKLEGVQRVAAAPEAVWSLLNNPEQLAKCLPGCEELIAAGNDMYRAKLSVAIAAVSGKYSGSVQILEKVEPRPAVGGAGRMRLRIEGRGAPGFMKGEGTLKLVAKGNETEIQYGGEAQVGGVIAAVGQRMVEGAAKIIVGQFFDAMKKQLAGASGE